MASSTPCTLPGKCVLCRLGAPASITVKNPTWPAIMRVVLYTLAEGNPSMRYFGLKSDIYPFIDSHWNVLCTGKTTKWHKPMQDALSHGLNLFVSGRGHHGTGYWGLKVHSDPWSAMEGEENEESVAAIVFPLSQKPDAKKRRRTEDGFDIRKMRNELRGSVKELNGELLRMEDRLKGMKSEFEQYKVDSARSVKLFNDSKLLAEKEVMQYRKMWRDNGGSATSRPQSPPTLN